MNNLQEAYVRGFCKTAEAHGVSPEKLMKAAGWGPDWDVIGAGVKGFAQGLTDRDAWGEVGRNFKSIPGHIDKMKAYSQGAWQGIKDPEAWTAAGRNISRWVRTSPPPYGFSWDALKAPMQGAWQGLKDPDAWKEVGRNFRNGFKRTSPWQSDSSKAGRTSYGTLDTDVPKIKPRSYGPARQQVPFKLPPYESTVQPISDDFMQ